MTRALVVGALLLSGAALAQDPKYLDFKMVSTAQNPFPYYIDNRVAAPAALAITNQVPVIEAAWNSWNNAQCAMPKARSQGFTAGQVNNPQDRFDSFNVTPVWLTSGSDPDLLNLLNSGFTIAVTVPQAYGGVLSTCDIFLNGVRFSYSTQTTTAPNDVDLQSVMTHEAGHCLGLDHFGLGLMQGQIYAGEQKRNLTSLDVRGVCERNPAFGQAGAECLADGGCDLNLKCMARAGTIGPSRYCTNACVPNTAPCNLPMECQPSTLFTSNNSCQYPNANVTLVGKACTATSECGSAVGNCLLPTTSSTGSVVWLGGYCTQGCEPGQPACPGNSVCLPASSGSKLCIASCRVGLSDCRPGYVCDAINEGSGNAGVCIPTCRVEGDCIDPVVNGQVVDYECRPCDGMCVPKQTPGIAIGTICSANAQCGSGQTCRPADRKYAVQQCTVGCGRGCGTCPTGSTCVPDDRGELYCLRTCSGPRSCGTGLRCADYPGAKVCIPACSADTDCPVGQMCSDQECVLPIDPNDAGCGSLCNVPDAGKPYVPRPDAGVPTGGGNAGCACSTPSAFSPMLGLVVLALAARRRQSR